MLTPALKIWHHRTWAWMKMNLWRAGPSDRIIPPVTSTWSAPGYMLRTGYQPHHHEHALCMHDDASPMQDDRHGIFSCLALAGFKGTSYRSCRWAIGDGTPMSDFKDSSDGWTFCPHRKQVNAGGIRWQSLEFFIYWTTTPISTPTMIRRPHR